MVDLLSIRVQSATFNNFKTNNKNNISDYYTSNFSFRQNFIQTSFGSNFLTRIDGITCPCCGVKMISANTFLSKLSKTTLSGTGTNAIEALNPFIQNMHPTERRCFYILKKLSKKYPDKNFQELLAKEAPKTFI